MKRIERPPHVLYVERDRLGSLICLWVFLLLLPVAWAARNATLLNAVVLGGALLTGAAAFALLFRERVIAIDRAEGELRTVERRVPWRTWRHQVPLDQIRIRLHPSGKDWELHVVAGGRAGYLVKRGAAAEPLRRLGEQLAADTGRPFEA